MEHYEIREMMRRTVDPALEIEFESTQGQAAYQTIEFDAHAEMSKEIPIRPIVLNKSNQLTMYAAIFAFIDSRVELTTMGGWQRAQGTGFPARCHTLLHKISVPGSFPIFREVPMALTPFHFTLHQRLLQTAPLKLALGYQIRAPGVSRRIMAVSISTQVAESAQASSFRIADLRTCQCGLAQICGIGRRHSGLRPHH